MIQVEFAARVTEKLKEDENVIGLAVAGSWLTNELDEFSDLDLIVVTKQTVSGNKDQMLEYADRFGQLLTGFTGEHVGEPRVLICLYDDPLLHVDIKFLTLEEFGDRIEQPHILLDTDNLLQERKAHTSSKFPYPDYQWIEDRFWVWIHYALLKTGRGELLEALDFLGFLRTTVLGPLLHIKNKQLPRGVRKMETQISRTDFEQIKATIPEYNRTSVVNSLAKTVLLYRQLRNHLFPSGIILQRDTEKKVMEYFEKIRQAEK